MVPARLTIFLLLIFLSGSLKWEVQATSKVCRGRITYTPVADSMLDEITPYMLRKVKSLDECISMCLERLMFCYSVIYETPKKSTDGKALCKFAYWQASNCTAKLEKAPGMSAPPAGVSRAYSCIYCVDDYPGNGQQSLVEMAKALINKLAARRTAATVRCPEPPPTTQNCQNASDVVLDGEQVNTTETANTTSSYADESVCGTNFTFYHQPSDFPLQEATYSAVANVTDMLSCAIHCHRAVFCRAAFFDPLLGNCRLSYKKFPCVNREAPPGSNSTIVLSCIGCK
uniref:Apple domain-containing protein n=1 Tax=Trichuris muris TaxID=70415 RepID=A0A5S6R4A6_TRIMR